MLPHSPLPYRALVTVNLADGALPELHADRLLQVSLATRPLSAPTPAEVSEVSARHLSAHCWQGTYDRGMTNSGEKPLPAVSVRTMTAPEYERWSEKSINSYAQDISDSSGQPFELALERARAEYPVLLPHGLATERTWLLTVIDEAGAEVGILWIGPHPQRPDAAYIYDIEIDEQQRGRGLGRAAMAEAERLVIAAGITEVGLNVFGFNATARSLYDSLGYHVVATQMTKTLNGGSAVR